jgi:hypothetical protein
MKIHDHNSIRNHRFSLRTSGIECKDSQRNVPDFPRGVALANLRLIKGHGCLENPLYRIDTNFHSQEKDGRML